MSLRRVIEYSVAATVTPEAMEVRRSQVKQLKPIHIRLAAQSIDAVVFMIPSIKQNREQTKMRRKGLQLIGSGAEAQVYRDGIDVLKYVGGSEYLDSQQRRYLRDKKNAEFDQLYESMAPFVLHQSITTAPHIAKRGKEVVQTQQPFIEFTSLIEREDKTDGVRIDDVSRPVLDEISDFIDASWSLYGRTGLLPDTNGADNIVQHDNRLVLLDTQPITTENQPVQHLVMRQLGVMAHLLDVMS